MSKRAGFHLVPDDVNVEIFLNEVQEKNQNFLSEIIDQLRITVAETAEMEQPEIFAYGKMLNFLASDSISEPEIHQALAAALWELK